MTAFHRPVLAVLVPTFAFACCDPGTEEAGDPSGERLLYLSRELGRALPQIEQPTPGALTYSAVTTVEGQNALEIIRTYFLRECHHGDVNNCPAGVELTDQNRYTLGTILGLAYHAEMLLAGHYNANAAYETCAPDFDNAVRGPLDSHTPVYTPADSDKFVLDFGTLFDCIATDAGATGTRYSLYSNALDGLTYAALTTRREGTSDVDPGVTWSDGYQVYVRNSSGSTSVIVAINVFQYNPGKGGSRMLLLANVENHRFVLKSRGGFGVVGLGSGGYDEATQTYVPGRFVMRVESAEMSVPAPGQVFCLDNGESLHVAEPQTDCDDGVMDGFLDAGSGAWPSVSAFLELSDADETNLAAFQRFFDDGNQLGDEDLPASETDGFPSVIAP